MASPTTANSLTDSSRSPKSHRTSTPEGVVSWHSRTTSPNVKTVNILDTVQCVSPKEDPHAFHPPLETDSRGPCPALNTLANHGYLPRDGQNITREVLSAALRNPEAYNLSRELTLVLVKGGFTMMHLLNAHSMSLHELAKHGLIEHDASLVHRSASRNQFAPSRCDTILLDDLLLDSNFLTLERVEQRRFELEKISPLSPVYQEVARGEWALVLDIFGREHGGKVPSDFLKIWLKTNQFPAGWKPTHEQGLWATMSKASEIRHGMKIYQMQLEESPGEFSEAKLVSEFKSVSPAGTIGERRKLDPETLPLPARKRRKTTPESC